jgi:hypothetical protein
MATEHECKMDRVRDNANDPFRRYSFAPNNKFKCTFMSMRSHPHLIEDHGSCSVVYADNGYHGDLAPSLTRSVRIWWL